MFSFLAVSATLAQPGPSDGTNPQQRAYPISFEAIPVFLNDTLAHVNIHYRIRDDFFILLSNTDKTIDAPFVGHGEMAVELLSEQGTSVAREIRQITLKRSGMPAEDSPTTDIQGVIAFSVPSGTYSIHFNVDDKQSERSFVDRTHKVTTRKPSPGSFDIGHPMFVNPNQEDQSFTALNHGTDVLFGERGGYVFNLRIPDSSLTVTASYELEHQPEYRGLKVQRFSGTSFVLHQGISVLEPPRDSSTFSSIVPIRYKIQHAAGWKTLYLPLPLEKLQPGRAKLSVVLVMGAQKLEFQFGVHWFNRPQSLLNLDLAGDALVHIASDKEMESLHTSSDEAFMKALMEFWNKRDPDTTTAFNEMMAEYYRRVDIAIRRYSVKGTDGYKSDRGRIYILYGSPTTTERLFSPSSAAREVWTYQNLGKRYIFENQPKIGTYVLAKTENL